MKFWFRRKRYDNVLSSLTSAHVGCDVGRTSEETKTLQAAQEDPGLGRTGIAIVTYGHAHQSEYVNYVMMPVLNSRRVPPQVPSYAFVEPRPERCVRDGERAEELVSWIRAGLVGVTRWHRTTQFAQGKIVDLFLTIQRQFQDFLSLTRLPSAARAQHHHHPPTNCDTNTSTSNLHPSLRARVSTTAHHNAAIADGEAVTPQSALSNNRYDCLIPCIAFFLPVRFLYDHQLPSSSSSIIAIFAFQRLSHASLVSVFNHRNTTTSQLYDIPYAPYHAFYGLVDYH
ncbi:hypothetical protein CC1G_13775 [Coprinopsis cinerea okayama7|uniref:Uncharacterized protein n=1 Tax=Coprinopsis cinerea (strain Okayama-7 / 130 / ATCC MYA-4618 / FGSC 9003) TaxID=240176 RepID=D6RKC2_COPC7|nr:hypothetical protein CC1G_13775 [Coprinopsis cinerea okayama7\|eukprot:XP_002912243.1 hypothetical protein CC1G_13775 [Coprinopsis cinerea okayama7\